MNVLVGQSGGPTAVINASVYGVLREWEESGRPGTVYGMRFGVEGALEGLIVDLCRLPRSEMERLRVSPSAALGTCRYKLREGDLERLVDLCRQLDVRYFLYAGGNDSADTAHQLSLFARNSGFELQVIGIPKTIDNDLPETDHCPGYGSIARFVAIATAESGLDTEAMRRTHPIKLIEVMGRYAGWVAAACALGRVDEAQAPHLVYVPERPFAVEAFLADVQDVYDRFGYCVVAMSENLRDPQGQAVHLGEPRFVDPFGHPYFEGLASHLTDAVIQRLGLRARFDKPGTIQRSSQALASSVDRDEAELVGRAAMRAALAGETDQMVTIRRVSDAPYRVGTGLCPLAVIANHERLLPEEFLSLDGKGISEAFRRYALPLLGDPLPEYLRPE